MGIGGISVGSLLLILVIVLLVFGTKKLRNIGSDLGGAIKGFRTAMREGENEKDAGEDKEPPRLQEPRAAQSAAQTAEAERQEAGRDRSSS